MKDEILNRLEKEIAFSKEMNMPVMTMGLIQAKNVVAELLEKKDSVRLRTEVQWFAEQMELALQENDHKCGWANSHKDYLIEMLYRNASKAISCDNVKYSVNVANYAMMLADNNSRKGVLD